MIPSRRLAAIMAADIAGFSAAMERDEEGTFAQVQELRQKIIEPKINEHAGRLVKTTGDGFLVEFASPIAAMRCALAIQANAATASLKLRIGLNLGDVIVQENGDVYGDGVNVAARLEALADPGGVLISGKVHSEVEGKVDVAFEDRGEQQVKNIARPVRVYAALMRVAYPLGTTVSASRDNKPLPLSDKPSIAVLPFQNMSGDPEQEYFADGMVEDIITALSRLRWLFVIARNSSFTYKGRAVDVKQVARELSVRYVLEGSVRKGNNRVRVTAQLIDATSGVHVWAERYDRDLTDIFAVQDEITASATFAIAPVLSSAEQQRAMRKPPDSLDAWEAYHRGQWHTQKWEQRENEVAKQFFQRAIDIDPDFAAGYYGLALSYIYDVVTYASGDAVEKVKIARPLAHRAVALDDADATGHFALGYAFLLSGDHEGGKTEMERALALDPNNAWALGGLGACLGFNGQPREAVKALKAAMQMSPHDSQFWAWMLWVAWAEFFASDYEAALHSADQLVRVRPEQPHAYRCRAASLGHLGRPDAKAALHQLMAFSNHFRFNVHGRPPWIRPQDQARIIEGLRKAGLPE